jgi:hypothetical protein
MTKGVGLPAAVAPPSNAVEPCFCYRNAGNSSACRREVTPKLEYCGGKLEFLLVLEGFSKFSILPPRFRGKVAEGVSVFCTFSACSSPFGSSRQSGIDMHHGRVRCGVGESGLRGGRNENDILVAAGQAHGGDRQHRGRCPILQNLDLQAHCNVSASIHDTVLSVG